MMQVVASLMQLLASTECKFWRRLAAAHATCHPEFPFYFGYFSNVQAQRCLGSPRRRCMEGGRTDVRDPLRDVPGGALRARREIVLGHGLHAAVSYGRRARQATVSDAAPLSDPGRRPYRTPAWKGRGAARPGASQWRLCIHEHRDALSS